MDPEQLWETTMNPETRRLIKITCDDDEAAEQTLSVCMGDDVGVRKNFIFNCYDKGIEEAIAEMGDSSEFIDEDIPEESINEDDLNEAG